MSATIVPFPQDRNTTRVRSAALSIINRDSIRATKYWRTECNRLYGWLQTLGMADADIRMEIDCYARAVMDEIDSLRSPVHHGGDAA